MAKESRPTVDLTKTIGELLAEHPDLAGVLDEMGLSDAPADATLPSVAAQAEVDMGVIAFVLESSGYEVVNFTREGPAFESPLPQIIEHFIGNGSDDELSEVAATAETPTVARLEMAVRRAQREGRLPTSDQLGNA